MEGGQSAIYDIPLVTISPQVIKATVHEKNEQKTINFIRGDSKLEYHADNFSQFINQVKAKGFQIKGKSVDSGKFEAIKGNTRIVFKCPGGGRIEHKYNNNVCFIYGYSKSYGRVDHTIAQKLISASLHYPINQIKTSKQGY